MAKVTNINNNKNVIHIDLEESYLDFNIAGKVFKVPLGDDARLEIIKAGDEYQEAVDKLEEIEIQDPENITTDEYIRLLERSEELLKYALNKSLNSEKAYDYIYENTKDILRVVRVYRMVQSEVEAYFGANTAVDPDYRSQYLQKVNAKKKK
ncbi:phage tail assembly chaperone [Paenilisteria rocourtiae]|uniref:Tail assembly chaperone Gp14-like protein n=1 Tax=Listeria rocourtiae TaxID=647910 RepID=A0A4R6ZP50_9LIST|nr:phage tail assembly chaperone [Listeria rocourtiae]EUJ51795.1 gp14 [Listeria rocourtiae FSL F6-920]TDR54185.1 tail assembly chaperone Gp14-like protein [Listeria rocourtiae]